MTAFLPLAVVGRERAVVGRELLDVVRRELLDVVGRERPDPFLDSEEDEERFFIVLVARPSST